MSKFVVQGWIRGKLLYRTFDNVGMDPYSYYYANHTDFKFGKVNQTKRIKSYKYIEKGSNVTFFITFGYNEIGIRFNLETIGEKNELIIFESLIKKAVLAYRQLKKDFLQNFCPNTIKITFDWEALLLSIHGFFRGLQTKQKNQLLQKMKNSLKTYSTIVKIATLQNLNDYPKQMIIPKKIFPMSAPLNLPLNDFRRIILTIDEDYLFFIKHHLFATQRLVGDVSHGLQDVAKWGFVSSLFLSDFHFENEDYYKNLARFQKSIQKPLEKTLFFGLDTQEESLNLLEKTANLLEKKLKEFGNISNSIYDSIKNTKNEFQINNLLNDMKSLPHSISVAYGILTEQNLGSFSYYEGDLKDLRLDFQGIKIKYRKRELYLTSGILLFFFGTILVLNFFAEWKLTTGISQIADILQILTFVVAFIYLAMRQFRIK